VQHGERFGDPKSHVFFKFFLILLTKFWCIPHANSFVTGTAVVKTHTASFCVFFFYRPTGRPKRTSLPLDCHSNAINRNHFVSSARHSTKA
jgi:hypothetical protein